MKKTLFILCLLSLGPVFLFAQITFKLSESEPRVSKPLEVGKGKDKSIIGNVTCSLKDTTNLSDATIDIKFENLEETDFWVFFKKELDDKELRKRHIFRDKKRLKNANTKIEACQWLDGDIMILAPTKEFTIIKDLKVERGKEMVYPVPFFSAEKKKTFLNLCNRTVLMGIDKVTLNITVEDKIDSTSYKRFVHELECLSNAYQHAIENGQFCTNPKCKNPEHRSSTLDRRAHDYRWQKEELRIGIVKTQNQWPSGSKQYKMYQELFRQLESIRLDDIFLDNNPNLDCKTPPPPPPPIRPHHCDYCKDPLKTLKTKLESYYAKYSDKTEIDQKDWLEVERIYKCSKQPKRASEKDAKSWNELIQHYYNLLYQLPKKKP